MLRTDRLTAREREILQLIGRFHYSSKEAGLRAGITPKRVDELCASAVRKLDASDRRDAIRILQDELAGTPGSNPAPGSSRAPSAPAPAQEAGVSEDIPRAVAYAPSSDQHAPPPPEHAERRRSERPDVGRPGDSVPGDRVAAQQGAGAGLHDGALEGSSIPAGADEPGEHPGGWRSAGRPGVLSWVTGRVRFSELTPPQRMVAVLLLTGLLGSCVGWAVANSMTVGRALQPWVRSLEAPRHLGDVSWKSTPSPRPLKHPSTSTQR